MRLIVIGIDFSKSSLATARWACGFVAPEEEVVLAHVLPGGQLPDFLKGIVGREGDDPEGAESAVLASLEELGGRLPCLAAARVVRGRPAPALAGLGEELYADLLAIGPHGQRARRLGTTAEQLVRLSDRPVLVVREPRAPTPERVLIAVDDTPAAAEVLRWGRDLVLHFGARSTVLHVLDEELLVTLGISGEGSPERARGERALTAARDWVRERALEHGLPQDRTSVEAVFGSPVHEIASRTEAGGHDLVVMGSRGAGSIAREILGSVASGVLRAAWCPVLVV